jgi:acyl dehydratase
MALDTTQLGSTTDESEYVYDWRTLATYALGIGAKRDELAYLFEGHEGGMRAYPTIAVVPAFSHVWALLERANVDLSMVVHGGQLVRSVGALPPSGRVLTTGTLVGLYDMKKFAQVVVRTTSKLASTGAECFSTEWSIIVRGAGNFGGPRPPANEAPDVPKDRPPTFSCEEATSPEQALLYRLSGDTNPLHADPAFAKRVGFAEGPILHGLATYGFAARALVKHAAGGDASRLRAFAAQFRKPVWPGETLRTDGWALDAGRFVVTTSVIGRGGDPSARETVLSSAWAELAP